MFKFLVENEWARTSLMAILASLLFFSFVFLIFSVVKLFKKEWNFYSFLISVVSFAISLSLFVFFAIKLGGLV